MAKEIAHPRGSAPARMSSVRGLAGNWRESNLASGGFICQSVPSDSHMTPRKCYDRCSGLENKKPVSIPTVAREPKMGNPCSGINRHEVGNARVSRERASGPLGSEFCPVHREVHSEA